MKRLDAVSGICGADERHTATAYRVSRWISIKTWVNPTSRCQLWDYVIDGNGERSTSNRFDGENGAYLDYFTFNGRKYALEQFVRLGSIVTPECVAYIENGEQHYLHGVDIDDIYNPIYIELDDYGEKVRVYRMGRA